MVERRPDVVAGTRMSPFVSELEVETSDVVVASGLGEGVTRSSVATVFIVGARIRAFFAFRDLFCAGAGGASSSESKITFPTPPRVRRVRSRLALPRAGSNEIRPGMLVVVLVRLRTLGLGRGLSSSVNSERSSSLVPKAASNSSLLSVDASLDAPEPGGDFVDEAERSALLHFLPCCA